MRQMPGGSFQDKQHGRTQNFDIIECTVCKRRFQGPRAERLATDHYNAKHKEK